MGLFSKKGLFVFGLNVYILLSLFSKIDFIFCMSEPFLFLKNSSLWLNVMVDKGTLFDKCFSLFGIFFKEFWGVLFAVLLFVFKIYFFSFPFMFTLNFGLFRFCFLSNNLSLLIIWIGLLKPE